MLASCTEPAAEPGEQVFWGAWAEREGPIFAHSIALPLLQNYLDAPLFRPVGNPRTEEIDKSLPKPLAVVPFYMV
jgi:hypothetical protein